MIDYNGLGLTTGKLLNFTGFSVIDRNHLLNNAKAESIDLCRLKFRYLFSYKIGLDFCNYLAHSLANEENMIVLIPAYLYELDAIEK